MFSFPELTYLMPRYVIFSCSWHAIVLGRRPMILQYLFKPEQMKAKTQTLIKTLGLLICVYIPKQINIKDPKTTLLNGDLRNWIYQCHWRYHNRHNLGKGCLRWCTTLETIDDLKCYRPKKATSVTTAIPCLWHWVSHITEGLITSSDQSTWNKTTKPRPSSKTWHWEGNQA